MTRPRKSRWGRALALLAAAAAALVGASIAPVDYQPYFLTPYYSNTVARIATGPVPQPAASTADTAPPLFLAGFGRARLTPTLDVPSDDPARGQFRSLPLAGFGNRKGRPATGTRDDLWVKAVAFVSGSHTSVIASADALIVPGEIAQAAVATLQRHTGLPRERFYFSATHTHASIGGWAEGVVGEAFAGPFHPGARTWFAHCLVTAVTNALLQLAPAEFGHTTFDAPDLVRNRLVGERGVVDPQFSLAVVRQLNGPTAVLGAFAAHATVLPASNMQFSSDYPGVWQRAIEERTGGLAVFLAGAVGSHSPNPGAPAAAGAERMGQLLADRTLAAIRDLPLSRPRSMHANGVTAQLPELNVRLADGWRLRPWIARRLVPAFDTAFVQTLRVGDCLWISTPCDFSGELARPLKALLLQRGLHATVTSFNGDYVGYVVPTKYYHHDSYESRTMSFFGPNVADYLGDLIERLTREQVAP